MKRFCLYCNKYKTSKHFGQAKPGKQCNKCKLIRRNKTLSSHPYEYLKHLFTQLKYVRVKQGVLWEISIEDLIKIYEKQKGKCKLSGAQLTYTKGENKNADNNISIDRINPSESYTCNNVQLVAKQVNFLKHSMSEQKFIKLIKLIYNNI
jgi:hypothetical protein|tara:strand:+ start:3846 stop:4295 length:450 start_codon:yes stop_codon:yes gene_type:complete